jgi:5'(3')-deoxyribonucleotidase
MGTESFIFGVDLDGVCADFYGKIREIAAEWMNVPLESLTEDVSYGLSEWGIEPYGGYEKLHRFAVTQRNLFRDLEPIENASPVLRKLSERGVRIRVITNRLVIKHFHQTSIQQTIEWLDRHDFPYWDLCFMRDKEAVGANLYIDDSPENILRLGSQGAETIIFSNSTNRHLAGRRAETWIGVEEIVMASLEAWQGGSS